MSHSFPRTAPLAIVSLLIGACGSADATPPATTTVATTATAPAPTATAPVPTATAPATATTPPTPAAEVPLRERPLPERIAATTRTVPAPSPQTDGPVTLSAELCTLDGAPFVGGDSFTTIGPIAWSTDGALYVGDTEGKVRRYTLEAGDACTLTLDPSLGEGGLLAVGEGMGARLESIVADAQGHVFVATSMRGITRLTGNHVDYHCDPHGRLTVAPDGRTGIVVFGSSHPKLVSFTDTGCTEADWAPEQVFPTIEGVAFLGADRVLVGGQNDVHGPHLARVYDVAGHAQGAAFGDEGQSMMADDHFCYVHGATPCAQGICVLDGNCRSMRIFSEDHAIVGAINLSHAVGVEYPWFPSTTAVRDGVAFVTVNQQRGRGSERTQVWDGFVFRLRGL